jgi:hypothetical protein
MAPRFGSRTTNSISTAATAPAMPMPMKAVRQPQAISICAPNATAAAWPRGTPIENNASAWPRFSGGK